MKRIMAVSTVLLLSVVLPSHGADSEPQVPKERTYVSERPLFFRVVFGKEGKSSMLGVVDESNGTGAGYDTAYVDENMNNDFTDEQPKKFPSGRRRDDSTSGWEPRFEFRGPLGVKGNAKYTLNIYSLASKKRRGTQGNDYYFFWYLTTEGWNYFFINGKMQLFSSAADALKGTPVRLGGECKWQLSSQVRGSKVLVSAGLKDDNGCTLRLVSEPKGDLSPMLTLIKDGTVVIREKMEFG
jgi:hypothetical protein